MFYGARKMSVVHRTRFTDHRICSLDHRHVLWTAEHVYLSAAIGLAEGSRTAADPTTQ